MVTKYAVVRLMYIRNIFLNYYVFHKMRNTNIMTRDCRIYGTLFSISLTVFVLGSTPAQWRFTEGWIADKTDKSLNRAARCDYVASMGTIFGPSCLGCYWQETREHKIRRPEPSGKGHFELRVPDTLFENGPLVKLLGKRWWIPIGARPEWSKLEPEGPRAEVGFPTTDQGFSSILVTCSAYFKV